MKGPLPFDQPVYDIFVNAPLTNNSTFTVQLLVEDPNNFCTAFGSIVVTVADNTAPTITCPSAVTANTSNNGTGDCSTTVSLGTPVTGDNCAVTSVEAFVGATLINPLTHLFTTGVTTVTWKVTDIGGNSTTCTQLVTIIDNETPTITCPADATGNTSDNGTGDCFTTVALGTPAFGDNCPGASIQAFIETTPIDPVTHLFTTGVTTVTWKVTDASGNSATCDQLVTVIDDEAPTITCPAAATGNTSDDGTGNCTTTVDLGTPVTTSNCAIATVIAYVGGNPINPVTYLFSAAAPTTVTWIVTDASGNSASCTQLVTVTDNESPLISCPVTGNADRDTDLDECNYIVQGTEFDATATDNCNLISLTYSLSGVTSGTGTSLAGVVFAKGVTTVTWTASDGLNTNTVCSFTVTVIDNQSPDLICPADIFVMAHPTNCNAIVTIVPATATDNCNEILVINGTRPGGLPLSDPYPIGQTIITWTVVDPSGNLSVCEQLVEVNGEVDVTIQCPATVVVNNTPGLCTALVPPASLGTPSIVTGCGSVTFTRERVGSPTSLNAPYPVGNTTIIWRAINGFGDVVATCNQIVTVVDNQAPSFTCPVNVNVSNDAGQCNADVTITTPAATDNCGVQSVVNDFNNTNNASGNYPVGTTIVTWTITDIHGVITTCQQTVTVNDTEAPVITCPAPVTINCEDSQLPSNTGSATATDNCDSILRSPLVKC